MKDVELGLNAEMAKSIIDELVKRIEELEEEVEVVISLNKSLALLNKEYSNKLLNTTVSLTKKEKVIEKDCPYSFLKGKTRDFCTTLLDIYGTDTVVFVKDPTYLKLLDEVKLYNFNSSLLSLDRRKYAKVGLSKNNSIVKSFQFTPKMYDREFTESNE